MVLLIGVMGLIEIAQKIKGGGCPRITEQRGNEIKFNGAKVGIPEFSVDVGAISNKIQEFYKIQQVSVALDNSQFLLCDQISRLQENDSLKDDLIRVRLQLILAFSQLHGIVGAYDVMPVDEIRHQVSNWIEKMSALNDDIISAIAPGQRVVKGARGGKNNVASKLSDDIRQEISNFQDIDETEMKKAIIIFKE